MKYSFSKKLLFVFLTAFLCLSSGIFANDEAKLLFCTQFDRKISNDEKIRLIFSSKTADTLNDENAIWSGGIRWIKKLDQMDFHSGFKHVVQSKNKPGEDRFEMGLQINQQFETVKLDYRISYDYQDFTNNSIKHRVGNRIRLYKPTGKKQKLFLMGSAFYDMDKKEWTTLIPAIGKQISIQKDVKLEVYYGLDYRKKDSWKFKEHLISFEITYNT